VVNSNLRTKIIEAALVLFEKHGYHGVTVNQIIKVAGTSKGGFYHHFTSKDELLYVIHDTFITYVLEKATLAKETYHSPTKQLQAILKEFVKVFDLYKPHITVFYQENIYLRPQYEKQIKKKRDQFKQMISDVIHEGKHRGEFRSTIDIEITTMAILGIVNWTYMWYDPAGQKTIDDISEIFIDLIFHAILQEDIGEPNQSALIKKDFC